MMMDRRLVVALTGRNDDAVLVRYADALIAHHCSAGVVCESQARDALPAETSRSITVHQVKGLVLSLPDHVEFVHTGSPAGVDRLNDLAASPATHALIVGESMGRRRVRDLVRRAGCSIWFVPNHPTPIVRRILVPIDFSVRSADCVRVATVLARLSGATEQCLAVHVYFNESLGTDPVQDQAIRTTLESTYARFMKSIDALNVVVRPLFREAAHVARAINRAADDEDADLIVLSTRGRNWASKFVRESVAEQTLTDCRVPILVLKHFGAQLGLLRALNEPASGWPSGLQFN